MRKRVVGRIVMAAIAVVFALLALQSTHKVDPEQLHEGFRAVTYAVLCLVGLIGYRYFED